MISLKSKITAIAAIALAGGAAVVLATPALAATTPAPAITNDPNAGNGTLNVSFYNAAGDQVTSGNDLTHLFDYALASSAGRAGANRATVYFAFPDSTKANSQSWFRSAKSGSTIYPNSNAPAPLNSATNPLATLTPTDGNLAGLLPTTTQDHSAGYDGILQVRVYDSGPGVPVQSSPFWASDIYYDQSANTWQQVYPTVSTVATSVSPITATPASPAPAGTTSVSLSATVSATDGSHPNGSAHLFDGASDLGPVTFTRSTGALDATATVTDDSSHAYSFKFAPSGTYTGSSSPVLNYSVGGIAHATSTALTAPASATVNDTVKFTATVNDTKTGGALGAGTGAVQFKIDGNAVGSPVPLTSTGATYDYKATTAGTKSVGASFVPTDSAKYVASDSQPSSLVVSAAAYPADPQPITVEVPKGTLVISTPYTVENPFSLGTMALDANGTGYKAGAQFGDPAAPAAADPGTLSDTKLASYPSGTTNNGVTVTDTRAGSTGWQASAQVSDFTSSPSNVISGDNLSFSSVKVKYISGNALQSGVTPHDISQFKSQKKAFADSTSGPGTVNITGHFDLTAPTSTQAGTYTATVNFTIV